MKSSATWTVTVAAAALLMLPGAAAAQTPPAAQPPATQSTPPAADAAQPPAASQGSAQEHLRQAKTTLEDLGTANLPARARAQVAELKKHMTTLEGMAAAGNTGAVGVTQTPSPTNTKTRVSRATANWGNEVAAMDKIVTRVTRGESDRHVRNDEHEAAGRRHPGRRHAYEADRIPHSPDGVRDRDVDSDSDRRRHTENRTERTDTGDRTDATPGDATTGDATAGAVSASGDRATAAPAAQKVDAEAAKRHLTEARNTLSQMTQLPEAGKLTGDARTQVTQLIIQLQRVDHDTEQLAGSLRESVSEPDCASRTRHRCRAGFRHGRCRRHERWRHDAGSGGARQTGGDAEEPRGV